jgi:hypothetical protein
MTTPETVPSELIAGDTWAWLRDYADYLSSTWTATFYAQNGNNSFSIVATASGTSHSFGMTAANSADKVAGTYRWFVRVTNGTSEYTVEDGWLDVKPNPAATGLRDHRSSSRQTLDAVNATLLNRATSDQLAMTINGRSISRIPLPELREWRTQLMQEVRTEESGSKAGNSRNIKVRFARG